MLDVLNMTLLHFMTAEVEHCLVTPQLGIALNNSVLLLLCEFLLMVLNVLGIEPIASNVLGRCSSTELHVQKGEFANMGSTKYKEDQLSFSLQLNGSMNPVRLNLINVELKRLGMWHNRKQLPVFAWKANLGLNCCTPEINK